MTLERAKNWLITARRYPKRKAIRRLTRSLSKSMLIIEYAIKKYGIRNPNVTWHRIF